MCVYIYIHIHIHIHIHTFFFSYHPPSSSIPRDWTQSRVLHSRTSLPFHSKWNHFHLLTPNSQSIPFPSAPPWQPQVCSPCLCVYFCQRVGHLKVVLEDSCEDWRYLSLGGESRLADARGGQHLIGLILATLEATCTGS